MPAVRAERGVARCFTSVKGRLGIGATAKNLLLGDCRRRGSQKRGKWMIFVGKKFIRSVDR